MKTKNVYKRISTVVLTLLLLTSSLPKEVLYAKTTGPQITKDAVFWEDLDRFFKGLYNKAVGNSNAAVWPNVTSCRDDQIQAHSHFSTKRTNRSYKYSIESEKSYSSSTTDNIDHIHAEYNIADVSVYLAFLEELTGKTFTADDPAWVSCYLSNNFANCHFDWSENYMEPRLDATVSEVAVNGITYLIVQEEYAHANRTIGLGEGAERPWQWFMAFAVVDHYVFETSWAWTKGIYGFDSIDKAIPEMLSHFHFPEADAGRGPCRTPDFSELTIKAEEEKEVVESSSSEVPLSQPLKDTFSFSHSGKSGEGKAKFVYDSEWFTNLVGTKYNPHLARLSMDMAIAATANVSDEHDGDAGYYIREFLKKLEFDNIHVNDDYQVQLEDHSIGVALGSKKLADKSTLIAVAIRGGGYGNEWGGNFFVGNETLQHEGFKIAEEKVMNELCNYINRQNISGNIKIWLTGYSRASAVCNLTAADLDGYIAQTHSIIGSKQSSLSIRTGTDIMFDYDDVYAYCFEVPACIAAEDTGSERYDNIFCIINPTDPVPRMPLADWKFTRYGRVLFIPAPGEKIYNQYSFDFRDRFSDLYEEEYTFTDLPDILQAPGLNKLMKDLYREVPSREKYVDKYQDLMMDASHRLAYPTKTTDLALVWVSLMLTPTLLHINKFPYGIPKLIGTAAPYLETNLKSLMLPHLMEYTLAWMEVLENTGVLEDSMERSSTSKKTNYYQLMVVKVKCPVYMTVKDEKGEPEARIAQDGTIWKKDDTQVSIVRTEDNGIEIYLPEDRNLLFEITAYDEGTMQVTMERFGVMTNETNRAVHYYDLPLQKEKSYQLKLYSGLQDKDYEGTLLNPEEQIVLADYDSAKTGLSYADINASVSGYGFITGAGQYVKGSRVALTAAPVEGEEFLGWFNENGDCISKEKVLALQLNEDHTIEARFTENIKSSGEEKSQPSEQESIKPPTKSNAEKYEHSSGNPSDNKKSESSPLLFILIGMLVVAGTIAIVVFKKRNNNSSQE